MPLPRGRRLANVFLPAGPPTVCSAAPSNAARHLRLVSSAPAADSVVAPPAEVRLTFSEAPQEGATRVRLLDQAENLVEVGAVVADGHVVDGELAFEAKADRH